MQAVCVLFVTAFGFPPAPYMGFGVIGAGRWQLRHFFAIVLQLRADVFQFRFKLLTPTLVF